MAKLRIFVSSTYYDLKHIRNYLERFIKDFGYEPVLYESGSITFKHDETLDDACYDEIKSCHMQILIIGGRYGSEVSKTRNDKVDKKKKAVAEDDTDEIYREYNSITRQGYRTALKQNIPVFIFIEKGVLAEYDTYKKNIDNHSVKYAHVQNVNVFKLIDEIHAQLTGNFIRGFEKFEDISNWLRDQWAGLFADFLKNNKEQVEIKTLSDKIDELNAVSNALKEYSERLLEQTVSGAKKIIEKEDEKIENEKALRFRKEDLIQYIYEHGQVMNTAKETYEIFKSSNSLEEFLSRLRMIREFAKITVRRSGYIKIFNYLKFKYQNVYIDNH